MFDSTVLLPPSSKDDEKHPEIKIIKRMIFYLLQLSYLKHRKHETQTNN